MKMENIRATIRLCSFVLLTVFIVALFGAGLLFCIENKERRVRWKNYLISRWASLAARIIGLKIKIHGPGPKPPFFLVSNHLSYLDILPFWAVLKTTFVAKSEINRWPFIGQAADLLGIIFINRENIRDISRVNTLIEEEIGKDQGVILFPEGTSSKGRRVLPFKSSLLFYPSARNVAVHHASVSYEVLGDGEHKAWKEVCWWGDMDFISHFWNLLKIKSKAVSVHFGEVPEIRKSRKELARSLQQKVEETFKPTFKG